MVMRDKRSNACMQIEARMSRRIYQIKWEGNWKFSHAEATISVRTYIPFVEDICCHFTCQESVLTFLICHFDSVLVFNWADVFHDIKHSVSPESCNRREFVLLKVKGSRRICITMQLSLSQIISLWVIGHDSAKWDNDSVRNEWQWQWNSGRTRSMVGIGCLYFPRMM